MQIHGPSAVVHGIDVHRYGTQGNMALYFQAADLNIVLESPEDCDVIIRAAARAKAQLLGDPS